MGFSLEDYAKALDERFGAVELDMGEQGKFSLTRPGRMVGKQKERYDVLSRKREALLHELQKIEPGDERMVVDIMADMDTNTVDLLVAAAGDSKEFRRWLTAQPNAGIGLVWEKYTERSEAGEA